MTRQYRVNVIIPVYNAEKTIVKCVESIIFGELKDISVILVDDCSKDNSWTVCQQLSKKYPNVFSYKNDVNKGVSYTRNHGLKEANGEFILFVDSDDWVSGRYANKLLETAQNNEGSLVICGFHFRDEVTGYRRYYRWSGTEEILHSIPKESFFDLTDKFLLQQLWNKIFRRKVIEKAGLLFDVNQSIGEDFQFVLDYMEAAEITQCAVINEPLYYYIRWNNTSLMSNFGPDSFDYGEARYQKLCKVCGDTPDVRERCKRAIKLLKKNYVFQMVNSKKHKRTEIIKVLKNDDNDLDVSSIYYKYKLIQARDRILTSINYFSNLPKRGKAKIEREKRNIRIRRLQSKLLNKKCTIISQNCIGGVFYSDMNLQFTSPTINLYFTAPDFIKFVNNLEYYIDSKLELSWKEEYPTGLLGGDVIIQFMHYSTCTEAEESWNRRKERINWDNIVIFSTDREGFGKEIFEEWKKINYPKVLFTVNKDFINECGSVYYPEYEKKGCVPDLIPNREFYRDNIVFSVINGKQE